MIIIRYHFDGTPSVHPNRRQHRVEKVVYYLCDEQSSLSRDYIIDCKNVYLTVKLRIRRSREIKY